MDDLKLAELLCSRLCHDLVSPVGAVNNGIELMEEMGSAGDDEAMKLVTSSGKQASRRLQFYRVAFGQAGTQLAQPVSDVRDLLDGIFDGGKLVVQWDPASTKAPSVAGWGKMLLNIISLASESLPRGGTLSVAVAVNGDKARLSVTSSGQGCRLGDEVRAALVPDVKVEALGPRGVQPYFTVRLAQRMGGKLEITGPDADKMGFSVEIPNIAS